MGRRPVLQVLQEDQLDPEDLRLPVMVGYYVTSYSFKNIKKHKPAFPLVQIVRVFLDCRLCPVVWNLE